MSKLVENRPARLRVEVLVLYPHTAKGKEPVPYEKKQQSTDTTKKLMLEAFHYLIDEYGCVLTKQMIGSLTYKFTYQNTTTGVVITYDVQEQYIDADLYRLSNGKITPNLTRALFTGEKSNGFSLGYIVKTRNPHEMLLPLYTYEPNSIFRSAGGFSKYVETCANQLKQYGDQILRGDFSSFQELEKSFREDYARNK